MEVLIRHLIQGEQRTAQVVVKEKFIKNYRICNKTNLETWKKDPVNNKEKSYSPDTLKETIAAAEENKTL